MPGQPACPLLRQAIFLAVFPSLPAFLSHPLYIYTLWLLGPMGQGTGPLNPVL